MAEYVNGRVLERDAAAGAKLLSMGMGRKSEQGVWLEWPEAAFLLERQLLDVQDGKKKLEMGDFLAERTPAKGKAKKPDAKSKEAGGEKNPAPPPSRADQYTIFRALRAGGHVVRFSAGSPLYWRVYERGVGRERERPAMLLYVVAPGWTASVERLEQQMQVARLLRLDLALAFVRDGRPQMMKLSRPPVEG